MKRPHGALAWAELAAALLITALIVALNLRFSTEAGALWRDEVSTVELATRPTYADVLRSWSLDSAPALYPTLLRLWSSPWTGEQDGPLRTSALAWPRRCWARSGSPAERSPPARRCWPSPCSPRTQGCCRRRDR